MQPRVASEQLIPAFTGEDGRYVTGDRLRNHELPERPRPLVGRMHLLQEFVDVVDEVVGSDLDRVPVAALRDQLGPGPLVVGRTLVEAREERKLRREVGHRG